ncbi:MAG: LuxR C-terminal-related transcriptional regulator [Parvularcula sp.]|jgi:FixJ family two-component response regulator|nr:LuxR C-terminal-related transcriptional regulator [Parvularcula sp.]
MAMRTTPDFTAKEVCILDPVYLRGREIADHLSLDFFNPWVTDHLQHLFARIETVDLVIVYDTDTIVHELVHQLAIGRMLVPFCAYSDCIDVMRIVSSIQRGAIDFFVLPTDETLNERALLACGQGKMELTQKAVRDEFNAKVASLSYREIEVARFAAEGKMSKEIAPLLDISPRTVDVHLGRIYAKLQISGRGELIPLTDLLVRASQLIAEAHSVLGKSSDVALSDEARTLAKRQSGPH